MIKKVQNIDNIEMTDPECVISRVKVFLVNDDNQVYIVTTRYGCMLPGGHVEKGESDKDAIARELNEELGVTIDHKIVGKPFYRITYWTNRKGIKTKSQVSYYIVRTNVVADANLIHLTSREQEIDFKINHVAWRDLRPLVDGYVHGRVKDINWAIATEIRDAMQIIEKDGLL